MPKKKTARKPKAAQAAFVFTGDPRGSKKEDPDYLDYLGYHFDLDGEPVKVRAEIAQKLRTHSHFTEAKSE